MITVILLTDNVQLVKSAEHVHVGVPVELSQLPPKHKLAPHCDCATQLQQRGS